MSRKANIFRTGLIVTIVLCAGASARAEAIAGFGHVPPISYRGPDGRAAGFAIQVLDEAARREGLALRWRPSGNSDAIDRDLKSGALDLFAAGMVTPFRRAHFYVSEPWWRVELSILSRRNGIRRAADLRGKRLALPSPAYRFLAEEHLPGATVSVPGLPLGGAAAAVMAVCAGSADAALITHMDVHEALLARPAGCRDVDLQTMDTAAAMQFAVVASRGRERVAKALRRRIEEMVGDGALAVIASRHPPISAASAIQMSNALRHRYEHRLLALWAGASFTLLAFAIWFISAQSKAQRDLRRGRDERQLLLDTLPVGVWFTDSTGRVVGWNPRALEIWGASQEVLRAIPEFEGCNPVTGQRLRPEEWGAHRAVTSGETTTGQLVRIQPFDGGPAKYILNSASPLRDRKGRIRGAIVSNEDVTPRVLAEEALRDSERRHRAFFERAVVGAAKADPATGRYLDVNQHLCELTGYTREEMLEMRPADLTHPEDIERERREFDAFLKGEKPAFSIEKRYVCKDGRVRWVHVEAGGVRDSAGKLLYTVGVILDITERIHDQEALRKSEARYRLLVEANPVGFVHAAITGPDKGRLYHVNEAFLRIVGYSREEIESGAVDWVKLTPPEWLVEDEKAIERAKQSGRSGLYEKEYVRKDGARVPLLVECATTGGHDAVAFAVDISERRSLEKQVTWMSGLLPICSACKQIRDSDSGEWRPIESYMQSRISADFSHGLCPGCVQRMYPDFAEDLKRQRAV